MSSVSLHMWDLIRRKIITEHSFYIDQAQTRLLSQFDNIASEYEKVIEQNFNENSRYFNPESHEVSHFYESAIEHGNDYCQLLIGMHEDTRLGVIAGMFHQWEKKLKKWLLSEMRDWGIGHNVKNIIWKQNCFEMITLLASFGFDARLLPTYDNLNAMRLVVNIFKHGDGNSFDDLMQSYPELVPESLRTGDYEYTKQYLNYTYMQVTDHHLELFSDALLEFWRSIPAEIILTDKVDIPNWFEKAYDQDTGKYK